MLSIAVGAGTNLPQSKPTWFYDLTLPALTQGQLTWLQPGIGLQPASSWPPQWLQYWAWCLGSQNVPTANMNWKKQPIRKYIYIYILYIYWQNIIYIYVFIYLNIQIIFFYIFEINIQIPHWNKFTFTDISKSKKYWDRDICIHIYINIYIFIYIYIHVNIHIKTT